VYIDTYRANPEYDIFYANYDVFGKKTFVLKQGVFEPYRFVLINGIDNCAMYKRAIYDKVDNGYFLDCNDYYHEDYYFWMKAVMQGAKPFKIDEIIWAYRSEHYSLLDKRILRKQDEAKTYTNMYAVQKQTARFFLDNGLLTKSQYADLLGKLNLRLTLLHSHYGDYFKSIHYAINGIAHYPKFTRNYIWLLVSAPLKKVRKQILGIEY
jgi:hypothetical protein